MKCRECALWDIESATDKAGRIRKAWGSKCKWVSKEVWPISVTLTFNLRPQTSFMRSEDGHGCQRFIKRVK